MQYKNVDMCFLQGREIYNQALVPALEDARQSLWIATANAKDLWVELGQRRQPLLNRLAELSESGVQIRVLHSGAESSRFERRRKQVQSETSRIQVRSCSRNHVKALVVDCFQVYIGSANLTGAGMGAKHDHRRNFEVGVQTRDLRIVRSLLDHLESIWYGEHCADCAWKSRCPTVADGGGIC